MTSKKIQDTIMRILRGTPVDIARERLHALVSAELRDVTPDQFARAMRQLLDAGLVTRTLYRARMDGPTGADGKAVWRYSAPRTRYKLRPQVNSWCVDRPDAKSPGGWHTVVVGTEIEARVCLAALNAYTTRSDNHMEAIGGRRR